MKDAIQKICKIAHTRKLLGLLSFKQVNRKQTRLWLLQSKEKSKGCFARYLPRRSIIGIF
jgi:hypothetical protein